MKKLLLMIITTVALVSCGKDKKEVVAESMDTPAVTLDIEGTYVQDDSLEVFFQTDGNIQYDRPITKTIKGSPLPQRITFEMPAGMVVENFVIHPSMNKAQSFVTITNIAIKVGNDVIDGANYKYAENFITDESFKWDTENSRYILTHTNKYPPGITGKESLTALILK